LENDSRQMLKVNFLTHNWLAHKINNESFKNFSPLIKGLTIDLGCGSSPYKADILKSADQYIGVDWENSLHFNKNIDIAADLTQPFPFENSFADTALAFQTMEHIPEPNFFLSECMRILKPEGRLILTVPFMWHVHEAPHDYFRFTRHGLKHLLAKNKFMDIKIKETTGFWQMWILKFNYQTVRYAWGPFKLILIPIWFIGQVFAPLLDKIHKAPQETASYIAIARKPPCP